MNVPEPTATTAQDLALLPAVVQAVTAAGAVMLERFTGRAGPTTLGEVVAAIHANDDASLAVLRPLLEAVRPGAGWIDDELAQGALPAGEWWLADPVEGNVNHVHGTAGWGVTATLVREGAAVLTAVHLPLAGTTATAVAGGGAHLDGLALRPSGKTELAGAMVATGQASPADDETTRQRIADGVAAMLRAALVTSVSVPATLPLLDVAAGRCDVFFQPSAVRSGLMAGALLVAEAGGRVSDMAGADWTLDSAGLLAAAPGLHGAAVNALSGV